MNYVIQEINEDEDVKNLFFSTLFEKMHLELKSIKQSLFNRAEQNLELLKTILDFDGAPQIFVNSNNFYNNTMTGKQIQKASYFGRYLSFSSLCSETDSWKKSDMNHQLHKMKPDAH
jgi:hypothetical protein